MLKENFYFKYLDIHYNHAEIENLVEKYPLLATNRFQQMDVQEMKEIVPSIFTWLEEKNIVTVDIFLINHGPGYKQTIHVDKCDMSLSINFPVNKDAERSVTCVYESKDNKESDIVDRSVKYPFLKYERDQVELKKIYNSMKPALLHIKKPHSAWNCTAHTRGVLAFRFKDDPWFLAEEETT
jgi:hypothetical protein